MRFESEGSINKITYVDRDHGNDVHISILPAELRELHDKIIELLREGSKGPPYRALEFQILQFQPDDAVLQDLRCLVSIDPVRKRFNIVGFFLLAPEGPFITMIDLEKDTPPRSVKKLAAYVSGENPQHYREPIVSSSDMFSFPFRTTGTEQYIVAIDARQDSQGRLVPAITVSIHPAPNFFHGLGLGEEPNADRLHTLSEILTDFGQGVSLLLEGIYDVTDTNLRPTGDLYFKVLSLDDDDDKLEV